MAEQTRRLHGIAWLAVAVGALAACSDRAPRGNSGLSQGEGIGGAGLGGAGAGGAAGTILDAGGGRGGTRGGADARSFDGGFASDFATRAGVALAAGAPPWTCATTLPTVPVADTSAARDVIRAFVAGVVGVPAADVTVVDGPCNLAGPTTCAARFAHDCAKSGGAIYDTVVPLAEELEMNAAFVEETLLVPVAMTGNVVMSGISEGLLVGMVVFNGTYPCR